MTLQFLREMLLVYNALAKKPKDLVYNLELTKNTRDFVLKEANKLNVELFQCPKRAVYFALQSFFNIAEKVRKKFIFVLGFKGAGKTTFIKFAHDPNRRTAFIFSKKTNALPTKYQFVLRNKNYIHEIITAINGGDFDEVFVEIENRQLLEALNLVVRDKTAFIICESNSSQFLIDVLRQKYLFFMEADFNTVISKAEKNGVGGLALSITVELGIKIDMVLYRNKLIKADVRGIIAKFLGLRHSTVRAFERERKINVCGHEGFNILHLRMFLQMQAFLRNDKQAKAIVEVVDKLLPHLTEEEAKLPILIKHETIKQVGLDVLGFKLMLDAFYSFANKIKLFFNLNY